jgi:hypothetical protein
LKRIVQKVSVGGALLWLGGLAYARDLGVLVLPIHRGKSTSSMVYEELKVKDDFGTRGRVSTKSKITGVQFSYGMTDQIALAAKGGLMVDPRVEAQGKAWESRAGYLYGIDLYNEVFPATGVKHGLQLSLGIGGFQVPLDREISASEAVTLVDQKMSGFEYHGAVLFTCRLAQATPYVGLRGFGSTVYWRNHSPGSPDSITGHAHGNLSVVLGWPIQLRPDLRLQMEGRMVGETAFTAGLMLAAF